MLSSFMPAQQPHRRGHSWRRDAHGPVALQCEVRTGWPGDRVEETPRGRSGLRRARWWVTPTRGNPRESATENRPPALSSGRESVRVKRWSKRPPAARATGLARQTPPGARSDSARPRAARPSARVDRWRLAATAAVDGWSPLGLDRGQNPAYRPARSSLAEYGSGVTAVTQRRLRDSWGLIGVSALAVLLVASAVYQVARQDWASAVMQAALGAIFIGVLVYSRTRTR